MRNVPSAEITLGRSRYASNRSCDSQLPIPDSRHRRCHMTHKTELSVGLFILMGFACALVLAFASTNSQDSLSGDTYTVTARFSNTGELKLGAPVVTSSLVRPMPELPKEFETITHGMRPTKWPTPPRTCRRRASSTA